MSKDRGNINVEAIQKKSLSKPFIFFDTLSKLMTIPLLLFITVLFILLLFPKSSYENIGTTTPYVDEPTHRKPIYYKNTEIKKLSSNSLDSYNSYLSSFTQYEDPTIKRNLLISSLKSKYYLRNSIGYLGIPKIKVATAITNNTDPSNLSNKLILQKIENRDILIYSANDCFKEHKIAYLKKIQNNYYQYGLVTFTNNEYKLYEFENSETYNRNDLKKNISKQDKKNALLVGLVDNKNYILSTFKYQKTYAPEQTPLVIANSISV